MESDFRKQFMIATKRDGFYKEAEEFLTCNIFFFNWFVPMMCSDFRNENLWNELPKYEDNESFLKLKLYLNSKQ